MQKLLANSTFITHKTYEPIGNVCRMGKPVIDQTTYDDILVSCSYKPRGERKDDVIDFYFSLVEGDREPMPHTKCMSLIISQVPKNRYRLVVHFNSISDYGVQLGTTVFIINTILGSYSIPDYCYTLSITKSLDRLKYQYNGSTIVLKPFNIQVSHNAKYKLKNNDSVLSDIGSTKCKRCSGSNISIRINFSTRTIKYHSRDHGTQPPSAFNYAHQMVYVPASGKLHMIHDKRFNGPYFDTFEKRDWTHIKYVGSYNNLLYELALLLESIKSSTLTR